MEVWGGKRSTVKGRYMEPRVYYAPMPRLTSNFLSFRCSLRTVILRTGSDPPHPEIMTHSHLVRSCFGSPPFIPRLWAWAREVALRGPCSRALLALYDFSFASLFTTFLFLALEQRTLPGQVYGMRGSPTQINQVYETVVLGWEAQEGGSEQKERKPDARNKKKKTVGAIIAFSRPLAEIWRSIN